MDLDKRGDRQFQSVLPTGLSHRSAVVSENTTREHNGSPITKTGQLENLACL